MGTARDYRAIGYKWHAVAEYFGVVDTKGQPRTGQNQGGEEAKFNGEILLLPYGFRGVASVDYLSSYLFRLAFGQNLRRGRHLRSAFLRIHQPQPRRATSMRC